MRRRLPQVRVVAMVIDAHERLMVRIASTELCPKCPHCSAPSRRVHGRLANKVRNLEVSGRPVTLNWERRHMVCEPCGGRFCKDHPALGTVSPRGRRVVWPKTPGR